MSDRLFKVLHPDGRACHGGTGTWHLPTPAEDGTWSPGEWTTRLQGELVPCCKGYHLCRAEDLLEWLTSASYAVFEAEAHPESEVLLAEEKVVVRQARLLRRLHWNARVARLFACDCAQRALVVWEKYGIPGDTRPHEAIAVVRRYGQGHATQEQLAAAWAAAGAAVDAAWAASGVAGAAARAAASAAAWAAAHAASVAAGDAASAAAWAAARAAAGDAARAAGEGARDAALAAERAAQAERLLWYLDGQPTTSHATTEEVSR
jgi:hypothetical protein